MTQRTALSPIVGTAVEWLRGCAIVAVIAIHTTAQFVTINALNSLVATAIVVDVLSHFAVPLFVGLSGFVLAARYPRLADWPETQRFYHRRFRGLVGPYLVFSALYFALAAVRGVQLSWRGVALGLLLGSAQGHLWFFVLIAQLYLLFPLLIRAAEAAERHHRTPAVLAAALTVQLAWNVGVLVLPAQTGRPEWQALLLSYRVFASHLFYFVLGIVAARQGSLMVRWLRRPSGGILVAAVVATAALVAAEWMLAVRDYGNFYAAPPSHFALAALVEPILYVCEAILLIRLAALVAPTGRRLSRALVTLGTYSFGIYLIHELFRIPLSGVLRRVGITPAEWLYYPIIFSLTLLLSLISVRWLSTLPFGAILGGARRTTHSPSVAPGTTVQHV